MKDKKSIFLNKFQSWIKSNPYSKFTYAISSVGRDRSLAFHVFFETKDSNSSSKLFKIEFNHLNKSEVIKAFKEWLNKSFDEKRTYEISNRDVHCWSLFKKALPEESAAVEAILDPKKRKEYISMRCKQISPKTMTEVLSSIQEDKEKERLARREDAKSKVEISQVKEKSQPREIKLNGLIKGTLVIDNETGKRGKKPQYDWSGLKSLYDKYGHDYDKIAIEIGCSGAAVRRRINLGKFK